MEINNRISGQPKVNPQYERTRISLITGPLLGLGYIIIFPFVGLASALFLVGYCMKQLIVAVGRKAVQTIVRA